MNSNIPPDFTTISNQNRGKTSVCNSQFSNEKSIERSCQSRKESNHISTRTIWRNGTNGRDLCVRGTTLPQAAQVVRKHHIRTGGGSQGEVAGLDGEGFTISFLSSENTMSLLEKAHDYIVTSGRKSWLERIRAINSEFASDVTSFLEETKTDPELSEKFSTVVSKADFIYESFPENCLEIRPKKSSIAAWIKTQSSD